MILHSSCAREGKETGVRGRKEGVAFASNSIPADESDFSHSFNHPNLPQPHPHLSHSNYPNLPQPHVHLTGMSDHLTGMNVHLTGMSDHGRRDGACSLTCTLFIRFDANEQPIQAY